MSRAQNRQPTTTTTAKRRPPRSRIRASTRKAARVSASQPSPLYAELFVELEPIEQSAANRLVKAMYASNYEAVLAGLNVARDHDVVGEAQKKLYQSMALRLSDQFIRDEALRNARRNVEHAVGVELDDDLLFAPLHDCLRGEHLNVRDGADVMLQEAHRMYLTTWTRLICDRLPEAGRWELLERHRVNGVIDETLGREALLGDTTWQAALADLAVGFVVEPSPTDEVGLVIARAIGTHAAQAARALA